MSTKITEIKRHVNKPVERYECELLERRDGEAILRYVSESKHAVEKMGITFPPGCITIAFYEEGVPYVFWGIFAPDEELLGYLVHICRDVEIGDTSISYLDMLLDIWFYPDGRRIVLDEDEVEECLESGLLDQKDVAYIEKSRETAIAEFDSCAERLRILSKTLDISGRPQ